MNRRRHGYQRWAVALPPLCRGWLLSSLRVPGRVVSALRPLVAAVAALALFLLASCGDGAPEGPGPGIYIAVAQPPPDAVAYAAGWVAPIRVLEVISGREMSFEPASHYIDLAWAPDGSQLAALSIADGGEEPAVRLHTWSRDGNLLHQVELPPDRFVRTIAWSPDSSRLALLGLGIMVLDADVAELGWFPAPSAGAGGGGQGPPSTPWSPDSRFVATVADESLLVADRDGAGSKYELPAGFVGLYLGWAGDRVHVLEVDGAGWSERFGELAGGTLTWTDPEPVKGELPGLPDEETAAELNALVAGRRFTGMTLSGHDEATAVYVLGAELDPGSSGLDPSRPRPVSLVIRRGDEETVVDLGPVFSRELVLDVVVVPGWEGPLPERVDAATPLPDPSTPSADPTAGE